MLPAPLPRAADRVRLRGSEREYESVCAAFPGDKGEADGSDTTRLTNNPAEDSLPDWSPDGAWLTFDSMRDGNREIYEMRADGTDAARLTNSAAADQSPVWSPDGTRMGSFASRRLALSDWQPHVRGYPRPEGATPLRVPLVPAYKPCAAPNGTHGAPLAFPSCGPPVTQSSGVFVGIGDGNPAAPTATPIRSATTSYWLCRECSLPSAWRAGGGARARPRASPVQFRTFPTACVPFPRARRSGWPAGASSSRGRARRIACRTAAGVARDGDWSSSGTRAAPQGRPRPPHGL
jgi:hypothetical protein